MNINDAFPSNFLKAADLNGAQPTVTITDVRMEDIGDDRKPVVYFDGKEKGVVLNKTNATNISGAYGPNTEGWRGKKVVLFSTWVDFNGKSVEAIRMRPAPTFVSGLPDREPGRETRDREDMDSVGKREFAPLDKDTIPF